MNATENFHNALSAEDYARLVALFGEQEHEDTRWVSIGAGREVLTFFAPRERVSA